MKKFFKKLKDKMTKKSADKKLNEELSDAYDPSDFDEKTGEYELSSVQFDETNGKYNLEEDENPSAEGETISDLLKKARETEVPDDELYEDDESEDFEVQQLDVSTLKEKHDKALPEFDDNDSDNMDESSLSSTDYPDELPEFPQRDDSSEFTQRDEAEDQAILEEHEEFPVEEEQTFGNIPDIPAEFNQDVRDQLTAERELPSPEFTTTKSGIRGVLGKLKNTDQIKRLAKTTVGKFKKLNSSEQMVGIFAYHGRPKVHKYFIWTLSLTSSAMIGQIIGGALTVSNKAAVNKAASAPLPNAVNLNKQLSDFDKNNLFKAAKHERDLKTKPEDLPKKPTKVVDMNTPCEDAKNPSGLPITLTHTVVLQDSVKSIAAVSVRGKKVPMTVREGDSIDQFGRIELIQYQKLIVKNLKSGECEFIVSKDRKVRDKKKKKSYDILSPKAGKKLLGKKDASDDVKNEGNKYAIKKEERTKLLANIDDLLTQALAIQIKNPDGSLSFKMTEIVPGSFYTKIGIQNGDIIKSINGKPITNLNQVMTLFGKISEIDQFQLGVMRNGTVVKKDYSFE